MKKILLYLVGGFVIVCLVLFIFQEKKGEVTNQKGDTSQVEEEVDVMNEREKTGKISASKKIPLVQYQIETSISKEETADGISIIYEMQNVGEQDIRLQFPSSQEYDYEIYNEAGDVVYRYSDEYMFAQVIRNVLFAKGKSLTFVAQLPQLEKGEYKIVMWAAARDMDQYKEELTFRIE